MRSEAYVDIKWNGNIRMHCSYLFKLSRCGHQNCTRSRKRKSIDVAESLMESPYDLIRCYLYALTFSKGRLPHSNIITALNSRLGPTV